MMFCETLLFTLETVNQLTTGGGLSCQGEKMRFQENGKETSTKNLMLKLFQYIQVAFFE